MITYVSCFQIALCVDVFRPQDRVDQEVPQLPLTDGHLGGGEEGGDEATSSTAAVEGGKSGGGVGAEREEDGGRKAKVRKLIQ